MTELQPLPVAIRTKSPKPFIHTGHEWCRFCAGAVEATHTYDWNTIIVIVYQNPAPDKLELLLETMNSFPS